MKLRSNDRKSSENWTRCLPVILQDLILLVSGLSPDADLQPKLAAGKRAKLVNRFGRETVLPIARSAFTMCHGDDENIIALERVEHLVGKNSHGTDVHVLVQRPPASRCSEDSLNGCSNFLRKTSAEFPAAFAVITHGFFELDPRFRREDVVHFLRSVSMRR